MKKTACCILLLAFMAAGVLAVPFAPTTLKINAPSSIKYDFIGENLEIPIIITGTPMAAYFVLSTKDKASTITKVKNGYLGWHYVNKIDTCVYISPIYQFEKGSQKITWNGKGEGGALVPAGDYTYYIFGYDNVTPRIQMTKQMTIDPWGYRTIVTHDEKGVALAQPLVVGAREFRSKLAPVLRPVFRWAVGSDPLDATFLQTTNVKCTTSEGAVAFQPDNYKYFFHDNLRPEGYIKEVQKWEWVPNGDAILQTDWGKNGLFVYDGPWLPTGIYAPGVVSDGKDYLWVTLADITGAGEEAKIIYIDVNDGTEIKRLDLSDWWVSMEDFNKKGQKASGPAELNFRKGVFALGGHGTCVNQLINPYYEDEADAVLWDNRNGDIIGDHNPLPTDVRPWVCNDYNVGAYKYGVALDQDLFCIFPSFDCGAVSFGLYAPDGTGIGYQALASETAYQKYGIYIIDYDSAYDGIYTTNNMASTATAKGIDNTWWFVAHDSVHGLISNAVGVAYNAPAAFSVAQNVPNPFNPSTTISFTLAKAGKVTVDVFNVAGQKVDTIASGAMSAGSHSVTWNASKFSAGMYFYTVKSGEFSRTMKMTLLK